MANFVSYQQQGKRTLTGGGLQQPDQRASMALEQQSLQATSETIGNVFNARIKQDQDEDATKAIQLNLAYVNQMNQALYGDGDNPGLLQLQGNNTDDLYNRYREVESQVRQNVMADNNIKYQSSMDFFNSKADEFTNTNGTLVIKHQQKEQQTVKEDTTLAYAEAGLGLSSTTGNVSGAFESIIPYLKTMTDRYGQQEGLVQAKNGLRPLFENQVNALKAAGDYPGMDQFLQVAQELNNQTGMAFLDENFIQKAKSDSREFHRKIDSINSQDDVNNRFGVQLWDGSITMENASAQLYSELLAKEQSKRGNASPLEKSLAERNNPLTKNIGKAGYLNSASIVELEQIIDRVEGGTYGQWNTSDGLEREGAAYGKHQIQRGTAAPIIKELGINEDEYYSGLKPNLEDQVFDRLVQNLLEQNNGNVPATIISYNAGPGEGEAWAKNSPTAAAGWQWDDPSVDNGHSPAQYISEAVEYLATSRGEDVDKIQTGDLTEGEKLDIYKTAQQQIKLANTYGKNMMSQEQSRITEGIQQGMSDGTLKTSQDIVNYINSQTTNPKMRTKFMPYYKSLLEEKNSTSKMGTSSAQYKQILDVINAGNASDQDVADYLQELERNGTFVTPEARYGLQRAAQQQENRGGRQHEALAVQTTQAIQKYAGSNYQLAISYKEDILEEALWNSQRTGKTIDECVKEILQKEIPIHGPQAGVGDVGHLTALDLISKGFRYIAPEDDTSDGTTYITASRDKYNQQRERHLYSNTWQNELKQPGYTSTNDTQGPTLPTVRR